MRRLKILTWHTHGSYLLYLTQVPHDFYVLSKPGRPPGYAGRSGMLPWGGNVYDLPVAAVQDIAFDCILFQDDGQYLEDQHRLLSAAQRALPKIYLEHDPPREHATDLRHPVQDANVMLVHVTHFNRLMWDNGITPTRVIEHGVPEPPGVNWAGDLERGLVVVNNLARRGRRLGADLYREAAAQLPLDLVGMNSTELGGKGEIAHADLPRYASRYRFFFNPIRYTSLGLAVIEAMLVGLPVVALATTEMATLIRNGENGIASTDPAELLSSMKVLLRHRDLARALGEQGRRVARERFGMARFVRDWSRLLEEAAGLRHARHAQ
jgi:hypothetical protein